MSTDDRAILAQQLLRDEGLRLRVYVDSVGKRTIGVGRNLDDVGISNTEAMFLLENDIDRAVRGCVSAFPWFVDLDPVRQRAIVNLAFNMGIVKLKTFYTTMKCMADGRYKSAAAALLQSLYAAQVGPRAQRVAKMIETGVDQ